MIRVAFATLLAGLSHVQPTSSDSTVATAVEVGGEPYANVRGVPCVVPLVTHTFSNSYWQPAVEAFTVPPCDDDFSVVYLKWAATCDAGRQYDRFAAVWVNGVELLRTSTAEPSRNFSVKWDVVKDVSLYSNVVKGGGTVVVALDNIVNSMYTSSYQVDLSLEFYRPSDASKVIKQPDQIMPISTNKTSYGWFTVDPTSNQSSGQHQMVHLPENTEELYLELFLSHHQCDEFFYSHAPNQDASNEPNGARCGADGAFREVQVLVDNHVVGIVWPFPLVYTGGLNPYLWMPIVSIGAFKAPTYMINLTLFLGMFLDNHSHAVTFRVLYGETFWLIDGNLLVYQDATATSQTRAEILEEKLDQFVEPSIATNSETHDNASVTYWSSATRDLYVKTSVTTSTGTKVYTLQQHFDFTNTLMNTTDGLKLWFESHTHVETNLTVTSQAETRQAYDTRYLKKAANEGTVHVLQTEDYPLTGSLKYRYGDNESFVLVTEFANSFSRSTTVKGDKSDLRFEYQPLDVHTALTASAVYDSVHGGNGSTRATYASASPTEGCFSRELAASFRHLTVDNSSTDCHAFD